MNRTTSADCQMASRLLIVAVTFACLMFMIQPVALAGLTTQSIVGTTADGASDASSASTSSTSESTSGDDDDDDKKDETARRFIEYNLDPLQSNLARGHGDHLDALLGIYDCGGALRPKLVGAIRNDMKAQLTASDSDASARAQSSVISLHQIIRSQVRGGEYASSCVG